MPIKPKPYICKCTQCGWEVGVAPQSDVLTPWEHFECCPKCGSEELATESLGMLKEQLWRLTGKMADSQINKK